MVFPAFWSRTWINVRYLTGFTGSAGIALLGPRQGILWVDPRYTLQAQEQAEGMDVIEEKTGVLKGAANWLRKNGVRESTFEASYLTCAQFKQLQKEAGHSLELKPAEVKIKKIIKEGDPVEEIMKVIDEEKIDLVMLRAHEEGRIERLLVGGSNDAIIRKMPCSVFLVNIG